MESLRKHIVICVLLSIASLALFAQEPLNKKKTIKEVKAHLKAERYSQAEDMLGKVMTDKNPEVMSDAEFYYLRLQTLQGLATAENRNMFLNTRPDTAKYFTYIYRIHEYGFTCDSLDRLPDEKGRVRPSYTSHIISMLSAYRNNIKSAGKYYYKKNKFDDAYRFFNLYLSTLHHPLITGAKDYKLDEDTLSLANLAVFSAYNGAKYKNVLKYLPMAMKDSTDYALLCQIGSRSCMELKDTLGAVSYLRDGWKTDPLQEYFYVNLIDYHVERREYVDAIQIIDKQLVAEPQKRLLWYLKGKCEQCIDSVDIAVDCYNKAVELQPDDALSYSSLGGIYIDKARSVYDVNSYKIGTQAFTRAKNAQNKIYKQAQDALEKSRKIAPNNPELWHEGLMEVYYKLNLGKELQELEQLPITPVSNQPDEKAKKVKQ
jgi:tetratricopeptide (TPR) repeat protein